MMTRSCRIWGTLMLSSAFLRFWVHGNSCNQDMYTLECANSAYSCHPLQSYANSCTCLGKGCKQMCTSEGEECEMALECSGGDCEQTCKAKTCKMNCSKGRCKKQECYASVGVCEMALECGKGDCEQICKAETCKLNCRGGRCIKQHCNNEVNVCNMHCDASDCTQSCEAVTCHITRTWPISPQDRVICSGNGQCCGSLMSSLDSYSLTQGISQTTCGGDKRCMCTKCLRGLCSSSDLYRSNYTSLVPSTASQCFTTSISTGQRKDNPHTCYQLQSSSSSPLSLLSPSPLPSFSVSSSSSGVQATATAESESVSSKPLPTAASSSLPLSTWTPTLGVLKNLANGSVSKLYEMDSRRNNSLKEAMGVFEDFIDNFLNITAPNKGQLNDEGDETRRESIFKVAIAFEKFALNYAKYHLSGTNSSTTITSRTMVLGIQIGYRHNATDFFLKEEEWESSINISSDDFAEKGSVIVGCVYRNLHELLLGNQSSGEETNTSRYVNTRIMTAGMSPKPKKLRRDAILKFRNLQFVEEEKHCMFWSGFKSSPDGFSGEGCHVDHSKSNSGETICSCNHLTHFAVLVDFGGSTKTQLSENDIAVLEIITYVGLSLSIIGMLSTITLYSFLT